MSFKANCIYEKLENGVPASKVSTSVYKKHLMLTHQIINRFTCLNRHGLLDEAFSF